MQGEARPHGSAPVKDRAGRVTRTAYNAIRQPVTNTDPLGRVTQFGWCKCGDLRLLIDGAGDGLFRPNRCAGIGDTPNEYPSGLAERS